MDNNPDESAMPVQRVCIIYYYKRENVLASLI